MRGKSVVVVERGQLETKVGTFSDSLRYYDFTKLKMPLKSREGTILYRTFMAGGSTMVCMGNGLRSLQEELAELGINLEQEFLEVEKELNIGPIAEGLLSDGSRSIMQACHDLGYRMDLMPKFIDPVRCRKCASCAFGCTSDAKWTAAKFLKEAVAHGAEVLYGSKVERVIVENGRARGLHLERSDGGRDIVADSIILSAGGIGTPPILQRSGIKEAGPGLFVDLFVNTYGVTKGINQCHEPAMALEDHEFLKEEGFILSPCVQQHKMVRFIEMGLTGMRLSSQKLIGIMTKTTDDRAGTVHPDGSVSKPVTRDDWARLNAGATIAKEILIKAGADKGSVMVSKPQGAHPGGTAALGTVVDKDLQTKIDNLFVCDASVLPKAPGLPPIVTLVALAKYLANRLTGVSA